MSDTPRTDKAAWKGLIGHGPKGALDIREVVDANMARELERELKTLNDRCDEMEEELSGTKTLPVAGHIHRHDEPFPYRSTTVIYGRAACSLILLFCLASCTSTEPVVKQCLTTDPATPAASCVAIDADLLDEPGPMDALRLWGHRSKFWSKDAVLKVRFLDGSAAQWTKAWQRFQVIDALAGITFERVCAGPSDIRVAFRPGSGHWSYLGTDARTIPQSAATMNLGLSAADGPTEWDRVALHECLHALGFSHEQAHPNHQIPWDEERVISDYARTQGWSAAQTRRQVLERDDGADFVGSTYDPTSIMHYPVERMHLTDPRAAVGWNRRLTDTDKRIIKEVYP